MRYPGHQRRSSPSPVAFCVRAAAALALSTMAVLPLSVAPAFASAQTPDDPGPGGVWIEAYAGAGGMRLSCEFCDPAREIGPAFSGAVGAYAGPNVRVGLEGGAWANDDGDIRETVKRAGIVAHVHPRPSSGLHLVAGVGWSGYRAELFRYDAARITLGAGWDLPLAGDFVVGNRLTLDAAAFASLENEGGTVASPVGLSVLSFGVYLRRR